jgi:type 2 lantibiotic biosynthesis protein LanM
MTAGPRQPAPSDCLAVRAATIDELLSDQFEALPGQEHDSDRASRRMAAWCNASCSGDWQQFSRRLARDGHTFEQVRARLATVRRTSSSPLPQWADDANWVRTTLDSSRAHGDSTSSAKHYPFEHLLLPLVNAAADRLWTSTDCSRLAPAAQDGIRRELLHDLTDLCAPALYERFVADRRYTSFISDMKSCGFQRLLDEKPVLLRLLASTTRQWLNSSTEFVTRLDADYDAIRHDLFGVGSDREVCRVDGGFSDRHRGGRCVMRVQFGDGLRAMYKPKDLRLDVEWRALVEHLNTEAPVSLQAVRSIAREGYGWSEFIEHSECTSADGVQRFFRRAGAWLALFHCFAASDIHQENLRASGDHPIPVDLETILQASFEKLGNRAGHAAAVEAARALIANSVMAVGLIPAFGRSRDRRIYAVGGIASDWTAGTRLQWNNINTDAMRPAIVGATDEPATNLPLVGNRYAALGDHLDDFISGFEDYTAFLRSCDPGVLFDRFRGLPVRKVIRPTQFYYMLMQRLKDDRTMDDGAAWSAQADFLARLADWDDDDPLWPLQRAERESLVELDVPMFVMPCEGATITDTTTIAVDTQATPGLQRAKDRLSKLDDREIAWQVTIIRQASSVLTDRAPLRLAVDDSPMPSAVSTLTTEIDFIADAIARYAVRRESSAAWVGLGWFTDADVAQLAVLGNDLYNGNCGIAVFLAAHASITGRASSAELALESISHLRAVLKSRGAAHLARLLGIGGGTGLGSVVYGLTAIAKLLQDDSIIDDALVAATLIADGLIAADTGLDVVSGSAGAILALLRLYADTQSSDVLNRAVRCGDNLLARDRIGPIGRRSWPGAGPDPQPLNGMSHGAAGFAYALALLAAATGREDFAAAAVECVDYERGNYDTECGDWRDFRFTEPHRSTQWCHGAVGIGLSRLGMVKLRMPLQVADDIEHALVTAMRDWPSHVDTLCCGSLGNVEFLWEAAKVLDRPHLAELSATRLNAVLQSKASSGDYRWNAGAQRFNVGLFRGIAGVGYTCLRRLDDSLPNVLLWE